MKTRNYIVTGLVVALWSGCNSEPYDVREYTGADPTLDGGDDTCIVETSMRWRLPAVPPFHIIPHACTNCDVNTCTAFGAPCAVYDAPCEVDGVVVGICRACCEDNGDGVVGMLRCARISPPAIDGQTPQNQP